jgi:hypothetical protein
MGLEKPAQSIADRGIVLSLLAPDAKGLGNGAAILGERLVRP